MSQSEALDMHSQTCFQTDLIHQNPLKMATLILDEPVDNQNDVVLNSQLRGIRFEKLILGNKSGRRIISEINNKCKQRGCFWTQAETESSCGKLNNGDYNLTRIRRECSLLKRKHLLDIHDRSLVLLLLRNSLVRDPVGFLHSGKPDQHAWSFRTFSNATESHRDAQHQHHGCFGPKKNAPADLRRQCDKKLTSVHRVLSDHHGCHESPHPAMFDFHFEVVEDHNLWVSAPDESQFPIQNQSLIFIAFNFNVMK